MTIIYDIHNRLLGLLSEEEFRNSATVIENFKQVYPDEYTYLCTLYKDTLDPSSIHKNKIYSVQQYLADRLSDMHKHGRIIREFTKDFDKNIWGHLNDMGNWKRYSSDMNPDKKESKKNLCLRIPEKIYDKIKSLAKEQNTSLNIIATQKLIEILGGE